MAQQAKRTADVFVLAFTAHESPRYLSGVYVELDISGMVDVPGFTRYAELQSNKRIQRENLTDSEDEMFVEWEICTSKYGFWNTQLMTAWKKYVKTGKPSAAKRANNDGSITCGVVATSREEAMELLEQYKLGNKITIELTDALDEPLRS